MYIPKFNQVSDRDLLLEAMRRYSFAILFGPAPTGDGAAATHLPLVVQDEGEHGTLLGHFACANPHWRALSGRETLVVFPGPHSYITPRLYTEELSVPTWNYVAIHAYGTPALIEDAEAKNEVLEALMRQHDPAYLERWWAMPEGFRRTRLAGTMGFRMPIARIEGKFKISQNRAPAERRSIQAAQAAGSADEQELARWMGRLIESNPPLTQEQTTGRQP